MDPAYIDAEVEDALGPDGGAELDTGDALAVAGLFARTIDAKSRYTLDHSTRVARIARHLAERAGIDGEDLDKVEIAGLLHDIGKLRMPETIIDKPGELSFSEDWGAQKVGSGVVKVPAITIDSLTEKYGAPDVVYVDVEGFECQALQGAQATLKALPDLYIEVHAGIGLEDFGRSVDKILSLLPPTGYELLAVEPCDDLSKEVAVPFHTGLPWLHKRFYLIALLKN